MLRITRLTGDGGIPTIVVEGRLTEGTMNELASALDGTAPLRIDLSGVRFADAAGVGAIRGATRSGAELERLPDAYRTVLLLRDIEELDTDETATMLGITPQAVKTRLHRARQALRTLLERELA